MIFDGLMLSNEFIFISFISFIPLCIYYTIFFFIFHIFIYSNQCTKLAPGAKKLQQNPRKRIFFSRMSFFHMGDNIFVLFWPILQQVQQDIEVSRRLMYAKVTFRADGQ